MKEQAILDALKSLPPGTLAQAARSVPGEAGRLLGQIHDALQNKNQEVALKTVKSLASQLADPRVLDRVVGQARAAASGGLARIRTELGMSTGLIQRFGAAQVALYEAARELRPQVEGDPILALELDSLIEQLADDKLLKEAGALLKELQSLGAELEKALSPAIGPMDPDLAGRATRLQARLDGVMKGAKSKDTVLLGQVEDASKRALLAKHPAAGGLARLEATLAERAGMGSRWRKALEAGLLTQDLETAWIAGKKVQSEALGREELGREGIQMAATTAHRVADLADRLGQTRPDALRLALTARLEEALLLRRMPEHQETAAQMVENVLSVSRAMTELPVAVRARVFLMAGQFYEQADAHPAARKLFRNVLDLAAQDPEGLAFPPELGRASLHLGRLSAHQPHLAEKSLFMAQEIGEKLGDRFLYIEATEARVALLIGQDMSEKATELARATLQRAGAQLPELRGRLSRLLPASQL